MRLEEANPGHLLRLAAAPEPFRLSLLPSVYRAISAQMLVSVSVAAFRDSDSAGPLALAGVCRLDDGDGEVWFLSRPGLSWSEVACFLRAARRRLSTEEPPFIAYIEPGNRAGHRLARLLGFERTSRTIGTAEQWRRE